MSLDKVLKGIFQEQVKGTILKQNLIFVSYTGDIFGCFANKGFPLYTMQNQEGKIHVLRPKPKYLSPEAAFGIKVGDVVEATVTRITWLHKLFDKVKPLHYFYKPKKYKCFDYKERYIQWMSDYNTICPTQLRENKNS